MANPSNLYAEKIYSEHPLYLWALDDKADYISLITESQRDIDLYWDITGGQKETIINLENAPFPDSIKTKILGDVPTGTTNEIIFWSEDLVNFDSLNFNLGTFCVGSYFYSNSPYLNSIAIGYEYTDTTTSSIVRKFKTFETDIFQSWGFISETFEIPNESTNLRIVIKIVTNEGGSAPEDYEFYINGISVGQWSENFNAKSLGVTSENFPSDISITTTDKVVLAKSYGLSDNDGYYIVKNNAFLANNTSTPMVYGATGLTKIVANNNGLPSLIFPGCGFLNNDGKYKQYTVEFWIRINSQTYEPKKIFGPIVGNDGLYVESGFLTLVIGNKFASHFIGEWFRPMLVDISIIENLATVLINGEEVISLNINTKTLSLPELYDQYGKSQDWLGFYSYDNVSPIEIDCFAIYPYKVPLIVAKRRWVYGQGVQSQDSINSSYSGTTATIDYPFADYSVNYSYPDFAQWQQGTFDNLATTSNSLTVPQYSLPNIFISDKTLENLYNDNLEVQDSDYKFLTFLPNNNWNTTKSYINFNNFNILNTDIAAIYGVFSTNILTDENILFKIYNSENTNSFIVKIIDDEISYIFKYNEITETLHTSGLLVENEKFAVGIHINKLIEYFGGNVASFFGNKNNLKIYVCGDSDSNQNFVGKMYSFGLCTAVNANDIVAHFEENGIVILDSNLATGSEESEHAIALINHTASYTLLPSVAYGTYFLDIGVAGYWEDYLPLSYFAQFVKNDIGNEFYHLDFLQFNIGYPSESSVSEIETTSSWTYDELKNSYTYPIQITYNEFDNNLFTNWNNYEDVEQKAIKYYEYNAENALIKSYITFQYIEDGANAPRSNFSIINSLKQNSIIDMEDYENWLVTKFSIMNNSLIYPSRFIDFNDLAIVYHLEFNVRGILTKPISLRRLELSSQAFNNNSFNPIGTKFGVDLFPYKRSGIYYDYKAKNPFAIYKGSTPYLYLTRDSGIELRGNYDPFSSRGISMPVNKTLSDVFKVSAVQVWMRYDQQKFSLSPIELFEIKYKDDTIKFYLEANSNTGNRAKIYAKSLQTGLEFTNLSYYWNGSLVREPTMTSLEWGILGIAFATPISFDSYLGSINIQGPVVFNNISYYQANSLQQVQSIVKRPWLKVSTDGVTSLDWQYWKNYFTWSGVLIISESDLYGVNPVDVYKTYMGTNKIIMDDEDGININIESFRVYEDTVWSISSASAV